MNDYADIVEVVEAHGRQINAYLDAGYRLLAITSSAWSSAHANGQFFVKKGTNYVVSRTAEVAHIDTPSREVPA